MENKKRVIILSWVSGSGKTTMANMLKERWFVQPIQFTTRTPRGDKELDEYVFLTKPQFFQKLCNWDFSEYVKYGKDFYGITKYFDKENDSVVITDNVGKSAVEKFCRLEWIPVVSVYFEITEEVMEMRLGDFRRESVAVIEERKKDFRFFSPVWYDYVIDGNDSSQIVFRHLARLLNLNDSGI